MKASPYRFTHVSTFFKQETEIYKSEIRVVKKKKMMRQARGAGLIVGNETVWSKSQ